MLSSKHALIPSSVTGFLPDGTSVVLVMPVSSFWKRARLGLSECFTHSGLLGLFPFTLRFHILYTSWLYALLPFFSPLQARRHFPFCSLGPLNSILIIFHLCLIQYFFPRNPEILQLYAAAVIFESASIVPAA